MLGAVFIPALGSFVWFAVMGGSAIHIIQNLGEVALAQAVEADVTSALFKFLNYFPMSTLLSVLAMVLVMVFFVTSANSAVFVLGMISENGNPNPTSVTKVVWGVVIAGISIVLIMTGGLSGLQSALVATALPLSVLMLVMCYSTYKGLSEDVIASADKRCETSEGVASPVMAKKV